MAKTCFLYDSATGEYLGEFNAQHSPMEPGKYLFPEYSTLKAPPAVGANQVAVFSRDLDAWAIQSDFRGAQLFDAGTGASIQVDAIGAIPDNAVEQIPESVLVDMARAQKLSLLKADCANEIVSGFVSTALGPGYIYASGQTDQANLMAIATESMSPENLASWNRKIWCAGQSDGWVMREHNAVQVRKVLADFISHRERCSAKLRQLNAFAAHAGSIGDLDLITWQ